MVGQEGVGKAQVVGRGWLVLARDVEACGWLGVCSRIWGGGGVDEDTGQVYLARDVTWY